MANSTAAAASSDGWWCGAAAAITRLIATDGEEATAEASDRHGESIIAAVVLDGADSADLDPSSLVDYVTERLAYYKKPREVLVVDAIPRLPSGKALRQVLKERFIEERDGREAPR